MVQQSTGEEWKNVSLSLSTARPSLASVLPELDPWYLSVYTPLPPMPRPAMQPMLARSQKARLVSAADGAVPEEFDAEMAYESSIHFARAEIATAAVEHTGTAYVFRAGRSVDIPSDGSP